jgi:hypothetical protein
MVDGDGRRDTSNVIDAIHAVIADDALRPLGRRSVDRHV